MLQFAFADPPLPARAPVAALSAFSRSVTTTSGYDFEMLGSHYRK